MSGVGSATTNRWPPPLISSKRESGINECAQRATSMGTFPSSVPCRKTVGTEIDWKSPGTSWAIPSQVDNPCGSALCDPFG